MSYARNRDSTQLSFINGTNNNNGSTNKNNSTKVTNVNDGKVYVNSNTETMGKIRGNSERWQDRLV
jgi:hypothetical protein